MRILGLADFNAAAAAAAAAVDPNITWAKALKVSEGVLKNW